MSTAADAHAHDVSDLAQASLDWPSITLGAADLADLELLLLGGFVTPPRYPDPAAAGTYQAAPALHVDPADASGLVPGTTVALRDTEGVMVAALHLTSVSGTDPVRLGGEVETVRPPHHPDYPQLWRSPADLRAELAAQPSDGPGAPVAVWTDALLHTADIERVARLRAERRSVVVLAAAGGADAADRLHHVRVRCLLAALDGTGVALVLVPLRPALLTPETGERVAALYGLPGSVVGAAPGAPSAAELAGLRERGTPLPASSTPAAVADELARAYPPRRHRGLTVLFTGLSGSGKSTLANLLTVRLLERGDRDVTLLDGDVVRTHLSKGLGFSRADRDTNVRRIGFVAAEAAGAGGTVVCAPIAPFASVRAEVRAMVTARRAGFVLVHVATPIEVCEARDRKGLYAKARAGVIPAFTGISDPYEEPDDAEVVLDTSVLSPDEAVTALLDHLLRAGWLA